MNLVSFIGKGLRFKRHRSILLLLGFSVGVMVMTVLLSVGSAILDQARDEELTGGGDVVLLPVGIDLSVLKTGGLTSMFFDVPNGRYLMREWLTPRRLPDATVISPEISRVFGYLFHDGETHVVQINGVAPERYRALWPGFPAALAGDPGYLHPTPAQLATEIDRFHPPSPKPGNAWAEWHYFNFRDDSQDLFGYVSLSAVAGDSVDTNGYTRGVALFELFYQGRKLHVVNDYPAAEIVASHEHPDLRIGPNTVRYTDGVYHVSVSVSDETLGDVVVELEVESESGEYVPPLTPLGGVDAFGYAVPVVRGHARGRVRGAGHELTFDGIGYHDHNWGLYGKAAWHWGIAHAGEFSVLYGRFAPAIDQLDREPLLFALFDGDGPRRFELTHDYTTQWRPRSADATAAGMESGPPRQPEAIVLRAQTGDETLELTIAVGDVFATATSGEASLFDTGGDASWFLQMQGAVRLSGRVDGREVDAEGSAYAETFVAADTPRFE